MEDTFKFRYRKEKGKCFVDCIANLYCIPREKVFDIYNAWIYWEYEFTKWSKANHKIRPICMNDWLKYIMPLWWHVRVWVSQNWIQSKETHACIYFRNNCIYDPNDYPWTIHKDWIIDWTLKYVYVFEWLKFDHDPFSLFAST